MTDNHERLRRNVAQWIAAAKTTGTIAGAKYLRVRARGVEGWIAQLGTPGAPAILAGLTREELEAARQRLLDAQPAP